MNTFDCKITFNKRYKQYTPTQGTRRELPLQPGVNSSKRTDTPLKLKRGENDEDSHTHPITEQAKIVLSMS